MKSVNAFLLFFFVVSVTFAQVNYEKGYFINKDNQKTECLIKNLDWKANPVEFSYKLNASAKPQKADLNSVKEFSIYDCCKFIYVNVKIDRSTTSDQGAKDIMAPVWNTENLFLKVLLEGKANLYGYTDGKINRFFYSVNDSDVIPLVYKEIHLRSELVKNTDFRLQLWDKLKLPGSTMDQVKKVNYTEQDLKTYFISYNKSLGSTATEIKYRIPKSAYLNLKIKSGINSSSASLSVNERHQKPQFDFKSSMTFRVGLEAELMLPLGDYKWGILFEPTFRSYKADSNTGIPSASLSFNSVELPIGIRYYVPFNDNAKLFFNGFIVPGLALNSKIDYTPTAGEELPGQFDITSATNVAIGGGFEYKKLSFEARYYTQSEIMKNGVYGSCNFNTFAIIVGYKFMSKRLK